MIRIPFTDSVALTLAVLGFTKTRHPAEWEDIGCPENGPKVVGHNEYDEWSKDNTSVYVDGDYIVAVETSPPENFPV